MNDTHEYDSGVLVAVLLAGGIIASLICIMSLSKPEKSPKPKIEIPSVKKVGEATGKATGDFGFGFIKGLRKSAQKEDK